MNDSIIFFEEVRMPSPAARARRHDLRHDFSVRMK